MNVQGVDHVEFYVGDGLLAAAELRDGYGLRVHVGEPEHQPGAYSISLRQGAVRLVLTCAIEPDHPAGEYVERHGDGVAVIALRCRDAKDAYKRAVERGAVVVSEERATIRGFGDVAVRFIQDDGTTPVAEPEDLLQFIDHVAMCVPAGELNKAVDFCEQVLEFRQIFNEYISVGEQGMDSTVVQSVSGSVTFTLLEPDTSRRPGQIDTFLERHDGAGVQHVAFHTADIAAAVGTLTGRSVGFLTTPSGYYDLLESRLGATGIPADTLRELNVLVDQDHGGQLFQIFTKSAHPRGTFFFELIERRGASTFGTANIKALYEAVERQHAAVGK